MFKRVQLTLKNIYIYLHNFFFIITTKNLNKNSKKCEKNV